MFGKKKEKLTKEEIEKKNNKETYEWIQSLLSALIVCMVVFLFFVHIIDVSGHSMEPTLHDADKMLVSGLFYKPKKGDIVIFKKDEYDPNKALVKRVIATEKDTVNIDFENGIVYVNGEALEEDYINEITKMKEGFIGPQTVPEGCVFLMGDNRNHSTDSRTASIGMVDTRLIIGKVYSVLFPLSSMGSVYD